MTCGTSSPCADHSCFQFAEQLRKLQEQVSLLTTIHLEDQRHLESLLSAGLRDGPPSPPCDLLVEPSLEDPFTRQGARPKLSGLAPTSPAWPIVGKHKRRGWQSRLDPPSSGAFPLSNRFAALESRDPLHGSPRAKKRRRVRGSTAPPATLRPGSPGAEVPATPGSSWHPGVVNFTSNPKRSPPIQEWEAILEQTGHARLSSIAAESSSLRAGSQGGGWGTLPHLSTLGPSLPDPPPATTATMGSSRSKPPSLSRPSAHHGAPRPSTSAPTVSAGRQLRQHGQAGMQGVAPPPRPEGPISAPNTPSMIIMGDSIVRNVAVHSGHTVVFPGATVADITAMIPEVAKSFPDAETLVLHIGTNDIRKRQSELLKSDFECLFVLLKHLHYSVHISGPTPTFNRGYGRFSRLLSLNTWLSSACCTYKMHFIDNFNLFWQRYDLYRADGLHLNSAGARRLSDNISYCICNTPLPLSEVDLSADLTLLE